MLPAFQRRRLSLVLLSGTCVTALSGQASAQSCAAAVAGTVTISGAVDQPCFPGTANTLVTSTGSAALNTTFANGAALTYDNQTAGSIVNDGIVSGGHGSNNNNTDGIAIIDGSLLTTGITNSGNISSQMNGIAVHGGSTVNSIVNTITGNIDNGGLHGQTGGPNGILIDGASTIGNGILNQGEISGTSRGISVDGSTINGGVMNDSAAAIHGGIGRGISIITGSTLTGAITNRGLIDGGEGAIVLDGSSIDSIANSGTLASNSGSAIFLSNTQMSGGITNSGTASGNADTISIGTGSTIVGPIVNTATGRIVGANVGIAIDDTNVGSITNAGSIVTGSEGIAVTGLSQVNGSISNNAGASIASTNGFAITVDGSAVTGGIFNAGSLEGGEGGIAVTNSAVVDGNIVNSGVINAGSDGTALLIDTARNTGVITNTGTLIGAFAINISNPTDNLTINNSGTLIGAVNIDQSTLNINPGSIMAGAVTGVNGILNLNTSLSTPSDYNLGQVNIAGGTTFTPTGDNTFTVSDSFNNHGAMAILGAHTVTITGNYNQDAVAALDLQANSTTVYGHLAVSGTGTFAAGTQLNVDVSHGAFAPGDTLPGVITTGTLVASTFAVSDNSMLFNFNALINGSDVDLQVVRDASQSVTNSVLSTGNTAGLGAARALDLLIDSNPGGDATTVIGALGKLSTQNAVSNAVSQTLPVASGGTTVAVLDTLDTIGRIVQARQESNSGISSGEGFVTNKNFWLKSFGSWADQSSEGGVSGYSVDSYGAVVGVDGTVSDRWRLGAAFAYANLAVASKNAAAPQSVRIDAIDGIFYGSYSFGPQTEGYFQADVGHDDNDSSRRITFGGLSRAAYGRYDSMTGHVGIGAGHVTDIGFGTTFTPAIRADYSVIRNGGYTENGAGALNLAAASQTADQLIPAIEGKFNHAFTDRWSVALNGGIGYNVLDLNNSITSSFVGGGPAFATRGIAQSAWVYRSGLGLTYRVQETIDVSARYDREDRGSSFSNQTASVKARVAF